MQIKIRAKHRCLFCKRKIKPGDKIAIYKTGLVIHNDPCKIDFDKMKEAKKHV